MKFVGISTSDGWTEVDYKTTWGYGYDFILDAAQVIIDSDFGSSVQRISVAEVIGGMSTDILKDVISANMNLRDCKTASKERGAFAVAGISNIMNCPVQIMFFNQTDRVKLVCPVPKYFEENGERVFDNYMDSIEIKAYCLDTERKTIERLKGNE